MYPRMTVSSFVRVAGVSFGARSITGPRESKPTREKVLNGVEHGREQDRTDGSTGKQSCRSQDQAIIIESPSHAVSPDVCKT